MTLPVNLQGDDALTNSPLNQIVNSALNNPTILADDPTTANGILKENRLGFYSGNLFITIESTTYKIALTAV